MQNENKKLTLVKDQIIAQAAKLGESLVTKRTDVLEVRKEMWREARIVLRDFDDVADLSIFAEEVARHERQYVEASEEIKKLGKMLDSPYFARIDFAENGGELEQIYIGRFSLFDDKAQAFHVYDWRAPISGLYYDFGTGAAFFKVPATGAVIEGEISLKRQYQIEKGELVYMFDNALAIEDDILRRELSKSSEARIKAIVNTIQADQNSAIRAEASDILVYGPAGCGKTSVGLHRLAYLLYRHRDSLSSAKVRIFSPNAVFSSYIEGIIPELGEQDVQTLDFQALLRLRNKNFRSPFEMMEQAAAPLAFSADCGRRAVLSATTPYCLLGGNVVTRGSFLAEDKARIKWLAAKFSTELISDLEGVISSYKPVFENVLFYDSVVCTAERLENLYKDRTNQGTLRSKTERVLFYVNQCYTEFFKANFKKIAELFNNIDDENYSDGIIRAKFEEEKNIALADIRNRSFPRADKIYNKFLNKQARLRGLCPSAARDAMRTDNLFFEDALILFYIDLLTGRTAPDKNVKHILIDEAQDLSILHHKILKRLYPASHFTVLADVNQALYPDINIHDIEALKALYPTAAALPLTKSYRSTYEIMKFASAIIGREETAFLRNGKAPVIVRKDPVQAVLEILGGLSAEYNTVGILLPTIGEAKAFYAAVEGFLPKKDSPRPLQHITAEAGSFGQGIMVMAVPFAKGLEFDVVICPAYKEARTEHEKKLFYLICTRALHELFLVEQ
ncbi:MAG: UvrD-helicase domain-containing protein [Defluviitaleaceae bacterium]|nr:UvrD-helicase domain-containing protein [Defluviitaleaceae bacterium]